MIYFDNGATTFPKPDSVKKAILSALSSYGANPGRSGHKMSMKSSEIIYECRENSSKLFKCNNPENVIFTSNCTTALNTVIKGTLKHGDHIIISSIEHNSVIRPVNQLSENGIEYSIAEIVPYDDDATIDNFRNAIKSNTKLIICNHASNVFGIKTPIERIGALCRIYGILFCVDAAQSAGIVDISLQDNYIDYLCTAGHKGLYGPMGTGLLIINSNYHPKALTQGGTGSTSSSILQPKFLPDMYESGTPNLPGIAGLNAGIKYVLNKGVNNINKYEMYLTSVLYDKLSKIYGVILYTKKPNSKYNVPVLSFNLKDMDCETVAQILNSKYNIAVRSGLHCAPLAHKLFNTIEIGTVRVVVSTFTTINEINYFCNAIKNISNENKFKKKN